MDVFAKFEKKFPPDVTEMLRSQEWDGPTTLKHASSHGRLQRGGIKINFANLHGSNLI